jgi:hypothetical protein
MAELRNQHLIEIHNLYSDDGELLNYLKSVDKMQNMFKDFEKHYNEATDKPYNFIYMNLRDLSLHHNFDKLLYITYLKQCVGIIDLFKITLYKCQLGQ